MGQSNAGQGRRAIAALAWAAAIVGAPAGANPVVIGFEDGPYGTGSTPYGPQSGTNNFTTQGFVFSPGCHFDWSNTSNNNPAQTGHWLGFDSSGCSGGAGSIGYNTAYLGPGGPAPQKPSIFVQQADGQAFSLLSFIFATIDATSGGFEVRSSNGGLYSTFYGDGVFTERTFSGAEWTDVTWLEFSTRALGAPVGFDDLTLAVAQVPEPGTAWLALLGIGIAALPRRIAHRRR